MAQSPGSGSDEAAAWVEAAESAVRCGRDSVAFLNTSEEHLTCVYRAVIQLRAKKFSDEAEILRRFPEKAALVHFLLDCVRNRSVSLRKVSYIRDLLLEGSPAWATAFRDHIKACATCRSVDLDSGALRATVVAPPRVLWPIPFAIELLALVGAALPAVAFRFSGTCAGRVWLLLAGAALLLPALALEWIWCRRRSAVLRFLLPGSYAAAAPRVAVGAAWCPQRSLMLDIAEEDGGHDTVGGRSQFLSTGSGSSARRPLVADAVRERGCVTFGSWWVTRAARTATIRAPGSSCARTLELVRQRGGGEGGGAVVRPTASRQGGADAAAAGDRLEVTCEPRGWSGIAARLLPEGIVEGLPGFGGAHFDGDWLVLSGGAAVEAWAKCDMWRLSWLRKFAYLLFAWGLLFVGAAVELSPGLARCGVFSMKTSAPLDLYFLLDASSSINAQGWHEEKAAAVQLIDAFLGNYAGAASQLHVGAAQFSKVTSPSAALSNNMTQVRRELQAMAQQGGGTNFGPALQACRTQLQPDGHNGGHAQVCVLITDGQASDDEEAAAEKELLTKAQISIMGIYIGSARADADRLRDFVCGFADHCMWFATASNFAKLAEQAARIAKSIAIHVQDLDVDGGPKPYWSLSGLLAVAPAVVWWLSLRGAFSRAALPPPGPRPRRDALRLRSAGANEAPVPMPAPCDGGGTASAAFAPRCTERCSGRCVTQ